MTTNKSWAKPAGNEQKSRAGESNATQSESSNGKSGKTEKTLENLLEDNLKDMYSAEQMLSGALTKISEAAYNNELKQAFDRYLELTKKHFTRTEKVLAKLNIDSGSVEVCAAMKGLIEESKKTIEEYEKGHVSDSALIIITQKMIHYQMASYGSICELADVLEYNNLEEFIGRSLDDEESMDEELSDLAMAINDEAKTMSESYLGEESAL